MKKFPVRIIVFLFLFLTSFGQNTDHGRLRGFVTDATSGEALPFCNVFITDLQTGSSTDQRGYYLINKIPSGRAYSVEFSHIGYQSKSVRVFISPGKITQLDMQLAPTSFEYQAIEKIEKRINNQEKMNLGVERLTLRQLESLPQSVESDIIRSLKYIPGVKSTGDLSAKYYVRGGTGDQNLVLLNGISLYNPFHALGLFSVIDAEMVSSIEFYKGDFPAEYGSRISSIMNVVTKDGNKNKFSSTASLSFLTAKALVEGPIKNGSFMITGRKSYSTAILNKFLSQDDVPIDFYDFSFKANYADQNFIKNGKFSVFGFFSSDKFDDPKPLSEDFKLQNNLFGFEWVQIYDAPLFSKFQFSYSSFKGEVIPNGTEVKPRFNSIKDFTFNAEFVYVWPSKDQITFGFDFKNLGTELNQENENSSLIKIDDFSGNYVFYSKYQLLRFDNFGVDGGARLYLSSLSDKAGISLEPRLKVFWNPISPIIFKGSFGTYKQEIVTITDENEVISLFDPWTIYPDYLEATRSMNISFGVSYFFFSSLNYNIEAYYKDIKNLAAINERKIFPRDPALINGDGEAYGIENVVTWEESKFKLTAAYTIQNRKWYYI